MTKAMKEVMTYMKMELQSKTKRQRYDRRTRIPRFAPIPAVFCRGGWTGSLKHCTTTIFHRHCHILSFNSMKVAVAQFTETGDTRIQVHHKGPQVCDSTSLLDRLNFQRKALISSWYKLMSQRTLSKIDIRLSLKFGIGGLVYIIHLTLFLVLISPCYFHLTCVWSFSFNYGNLVQGMTHFNALLEATHPDTDEDRRKFSDVPTDVMSLTNQFANLFPSRWWFSFSYQDWWQCSPAWIPHLEKVHCSE